MKNILKPLTIVSLIWSIILTIHSIYFSYISVDAPYYLSVAKNISEGLIPFKDINTNYVPAMMYINASIYYIFGNIDYFWFLSFQYFIIFLSAYFLFKTAKLYTTDNIISIFIGNLFYLIVLLSEGIFINLEVFVVFFVILSFYFLEMKRFILAGILLSLSMFSKQYGILNFIPFLFFIYCNENKIFSNTILKFILGSAIPIIIFYFYFIVYHEINLAEIVNQLSAKRYSTWSVGRKINVVNSIKSSQYLIALLVPIVFVLRKSIIQKKNVFIIIGVLFNAIPLYFHTFSHYFILIYPYVFLFLILNIKLINKKYLVLSTLCVLIIFINVMLNIYNQKSIYTSQTQKAKEYEKKYPKNSIVFLDGNIRYLYILNNYKNPFLKTEGYSFLYHPDEKLKNNYNIIVED